LLTAPILHAVGSIVVGLGWPSLRWLLPFFGSPRAMEVASIVPLLMAVEAFNILLG